MPCGTCRTTEKIAEYKNQLSLSGKGYGLLRLFGGKNINCTGAASVALLKAGVFNIPLAAPGFLSMQMYIRQYSFMSYIFNP
jgi:hypothetical protein